MSPDEYSEYVRVANREVDGILRARARLLRIEEQLENNHAHPFEQDMIYGIHYGERPSTARTKIVHGITITTRVLHQTGTNLSDISGADLLYEIPKKKFVVVQYKKADKYGKVAVDKAQLKALIEECPSECFMIPRSRLRCGSWYGVIKGDEIIHVNACIASDIFNGQRSANYEEFSPGFSHPTFEELFGKCYLGARLTAGDAEGQVFRVLASNRLLFSVVERGV